MVSDAQQEGWQRIAPADAVGHWVELRVQGSEILVRDSADQDGPVLRFTPAEIAAFIDGAKRGEFDDLATGEIAGR